MNLCRKLAAAALGIMPAIIGVPAAAQTVIGPITPEATIPERQSVLQRSRPDYDALGVRAGSFLIFPSLGLTEAYDSNVFVTQTDTKSDFVTALLPGVQARSDWNNHALNFIAAGEIRRYATQVGENNSNFVAATDGRLDIQRDVFLRGGLGYQLLHEPRTSPNTITAEKSPTEYQLASANAGFVHESGRLGLRVDGNIDYYAYNNGVTTSGVTIPETPRNRAEYALAPRVSYEIVPGYHAFVRTRVNWRSYMTEFDAGGFNRSSHGYEVDAGTAIALGPTLNGEVFAGYLDQRYDDSRLAAASGPSFGANLLWNVTALTSVRASVARTVEETIVATASSFIQTAANLSAEHELMQNLLLTAGFTYVDQAFQGLSRTDRISVPEVGARYLITRQLNAGLNLSYWHRDSNAAGLDYDRYLILANLRLQF